MNSYSDGLEAFVSEPDFLLFRRVAFFFFGGAAGGFWEVVAAFSSRGSAPNPKKAPGNVRDFVFAAGPGRPGRFLVFLRPLPLAGWAAYRARVGFIVNGFASSSTNHSSSGQVTGIL